MNLTAMDKKILEQLLQNPAGRIKNEPKLYTAKTIICQFCLPDHKIISERYYKMHLIMNHNDAIKLLILKNKAIDPLAYKKYMQSKTQMYCQELFKTKHSINVKSRICGNYAYNKCEECGKILCKKCNKRGVHIKKCLTQK